MTSGSIEKRSRMSLLSIWLAFKALEPFLKKKSSQAHFFLKKSTLKPVFKGTTLTIDGVEATLGKRNFKRYNRMAPNG